MGNPVTVYAVDLDGQFKKFIDQSIKKVSDLTVPLTLIKQSWFRSNNAIFALRGPGKYADLADSTKEEKQKEVGFLYPILVRTGRLADSLVNPEGREAISRIENRIALVLGTSVDYAIYHNEGTSKMPKRPIVFIGAEQTAPNDELNRRRDTWYKIIEDYVAQVLEAA